MVGSQPRKIVCGLYLKKGKKAQKGLSEYLK
jgi:hypothetical protein